MPLIWVEAIFNLKILSDHVTQLILSKETNKEQLCQRLANGRL